jgi:ABC-type multidrug transport system permease subunit
MSDTPESSVAPSAAPRTARGDPKLGRQALVIAVIVLIASLIASVLVALFATHVDTSSSSTAGFNLRPDILPATLHLLGGSALGIAAMIMGIRAAYLNRGRKLGILAALIAAGAPVASLILWAVIGLATLQ